MEATPPIPSPIATRASLSPRPNSHDPQSYPRSDNWSERGKSCPHSPFSLFKRFQSREGAGDHSRTEKSRQGNLGSHLAPASRTDILLSVTPLAARPLGFGRQLPSRGHRDSTRNLRSGRAWNRPALSRCAAVPRERPFPYDPLLFPYADAYTHRQQGGPHDRPRSLEPPPYPAYPSLCGPARCAYRDRPGSGPARCAYRDRQSWPIHRSLGPSTGPVPTWHQIPSWPRGERV